jgi:hypothetical protein
MASILFANILEVKPALLTHFEPGILYYMDDGV